MSIAVRQVKRFDNGFVAVDNVSLAIAGGSLTALLGPSGSGRSTLLESSGLETPDEGDVSILGTDVTGVPPQAGGRLRLPALRRLQAHDRAGQRGLRPEDPKAAEAGDSGAGRRAARAGAARQLRRPLPGSALRRPAPAMALARALAVEPRSAAGRAVRRPRRRVRRAARGRRLHDEVHVTTVLVTHDQEEAMDVADRVTVMNDGRIEQSGKPRDLYEHVPTVRHELRRAGQPPRGGVDPPARPRARLSRTGRRARR